MNNTIYKDFLIDLICEIKNRENIFEENTDLYKGYNSAIYDVLSLIRTQSEVFNLDISETGLMDLNLEEYYLDI